MPEFAGTPGAMPLYRMRITNEEQGYPALKASD